MKTEILNKSNSLAVLRILFKCISETDQLLNALRELGAPILEDRNTISLNCSTEDAGKWLMEADKLCMEKQLNPK